METDFAVAWWGERQTFATLVAVGSVIVGAGLIKRNPGSPDMETAHKLPAWRKRLIFIPSSLYLWFATWHQPPVQHGDNILADIFGEFALYDPMIYIAIAVVSIVAGTDLTGERALRLSLYALGSVVALFVGLTPVVLGLHVIIAAINAS